MKKKDRLFELTPGTECGGPLLCPICAMNYAIIYHDTGMKEWSKKYRRIAAKLKKVKNESSTDH